MPKTKDLIIFYILSLTWGIVWSLVGLFVYLFSIIFLKDKIEVQKVAGRIAIRFKNGKFGGASLGLVYLVGRFVGDRTHRHELGHTLQNAIFGPLFILLIAIPSALRCSFWQKYHMKYYQKHSSYPEYDSIWFEKQATEFGNKYFSEVSINGI